ncbi:hypothetical protein [Vulcanisaeta souniana]|uniref:Uncharacterized protein n=1 Tax=Vulcanisaeta souniana JCM 11219 TaxID=1293586 RepID=A0A830E0E1_9CREN|nr:hypothetical protein [Vulcanisaeta souniana]BDR91809.1 hypothetical protein Vsou_09020 [Vulcanisaeta souniana JCM 11219]GGI70195.1 hypothetical protein GCM10007112_03960 [Vulcanisaeta souniana JCM 11219]
MAILILKPRHDATMLNVLLNLLGYKTSCIQLMWNYAEKYATNSLLHVPCNAIDIYFQTLNSAGG